MTFQGVVALHQRINSEALREIFSSGTHQCHKLSNDDLDAIERNYNFQLKLGDVFIDSKDTIFTIYPVKGQGWYAVTLEGELLERARVKSKIQMARANVYLSNYTLH